VDRRLDAHLGRVARLVADGRLSAPVPARDAGGGAAVRLAAGVVVCAPEAAVAGRLTVWVEDVGRAGAAAPVLGACVVDRAAFGAGAAVAFDVRGPAPPPGAYPAVRAHLDVDGDGRVSAGDWVTTEHVQAAADVRLVLHPVR
jgi:hypothetical protein